MAYSFDIYGWYSSTPIADRQTDIAPPAGPYAEGHQANFSGFAWIVTPYTAPPPYIEPEPVVMEVIVVSAFQIRKALNVIGLRKSVEDAVAASGNITIQDGWHYAPNFYSDDSTALAMGAALGRTPAEMYALFQLAQSL